MRIMAQTAAFAVACSFNVAFAALCGVAVACDAAGAFSTYYGVSAAFAIPGLGAAFAGLTSAMFLGIMHAYSPPATGNGASSDVARWLYRCYRSSALNGCSRRDNVTWLTSLH